MRFHSRKTRLFSVFIFQISTTGAYYVTSRFFLAVTIGKPSDLIRSQVEADHGGTENTIKFGSGCLVTFPFRIEWTALVILLVDQARTFYFRSLRLVLS